jgi:hypothetical protein
MTRVTLRLMNTAAWLPGSVLLPLILAGMVALAFPTDQESGPGSANLRTFTNRAGWSVTYPRNWRQQSCRQCDDATAPDASLFLSNPTGDQTIAIERLADKPIDKSADAWLHDVAKDTVLSPIRREEWITLGDAKALKVVNEGSENIYALRGPLTVAIRYERPTREVMQVISTFRFVRPR